MGEDFGRGLGVRTRNAPKLLRAAEAEVAPSRKWNPGSGWGGSGGSWEDVAGKPAVEALYGDKTLSGAGMALQVGGNLAGAAGIGTLGYKMFGGSDSAVDKHGTKNPSYDEERAKFVSKIQQDIGGSKTMSKSKYDLMAKNSGWVKTAVDNLGMDSYNELRKQLMSGKISAEDAHRVLTNALAISGDEEAVKQAAKQNYVLPGVARNKDGKARYIVMGPMTNSKTMESTHQFVPFKIDELPDEEDQQA